MPNAYTLLIHTFVSVIEIHVTPPAETPENKLDEEQLRLEAGKYLMLVIRTMWLKYRPPVI